MMDAWMGDVVVDWWEAAFDFESESAWGTAGRA